MRTATTLLFSALIATPALAQEAGVDGHGLVIAAHDGDVRDPLTIHRPKPLEPGEFSLSGLFEYARAPVVEVITSELGGEAGREPVIADLTTLNLSMGVAAHERLRFDLSFPVYGFSTTGTDRSFEGPTVGDLRFTALGLLVRPDNIVGGGGFGLGLEAHVDAPTGDAERFLGRGGLAGGGGVTATYELPAVTFSGAVGAQFDPAADLGNLTGSDALTSSVGVAFTPTEQLGIVAESRLAAPFETNDVKGTGTPFEGLLSLKYRATNGLFMTLGGAAGLSRGIGVAQYRAFFGLGWGTMQQRRLPDSDPLGEFEVADACPAEMETHNDWQDDDGCPDQLGGMQVVVTHEGEPVADAEVAVQSASRQSTFTSRAAPQQLDDVVPGTTFEATATRGACLQGTGEATSAEGESVILEIPLERVLPADVTVRVWTPDGEPIPTARVVWRAEDPACVPEASTEVDEEGTASFDLGTGDARLLVTAPEYEDHEESLTFARGDVRVINVTLEPVVKKVTRVRLEKKRIVILEKVHFETAKAVIRPESYPLLNDVADTIVTNPQVGRVEVAGHTDSRGSETYNQDLSQRRAGAVRDYLVERGVAPDRLVAVGYGESKPIDTNRTQAGMEANRRVEFNLIDQAEEDAGAAEEPE